MTIQILLLLLGFVLLIKGADWLVDGGAALARKYHVSELAIGLTIIAFGTSMPEMVVNVFAAYKGHADIVYGNILGSNIFNLLGILGIAGLISPLIVQASTVWKEIPLSLLAVVILYLLSNSIFTQNELLSRWDGIILLLVFAFFLYYVFRQLKEENTVSVEEQHKEFTIFKIIVFIVLGLALLVVGGRLVVNNAVKIAEFLGISQTIIGLTIVAVGTSLPELATSVVAAIKKNNDIAVGNIIGSNIFNIFFIMGVSSLIRPIEYNTKFNFEMYFLSFGTILVFIAMFSGKKRRLDRWEAGILLLMYVGYTILLINEQI
ncbi:MAG: calcium/sodium antiporter [Bacteroidales bacterium]|jgi:cation:H+ antiporter|nr:calcium/sodium antiporter [Bacteroidales bacterium]OQC03014.1 MAG: Inner membrane protein YrbG [Bacteroidetes bacterium ADurb.Bin090]MBP8981832.1 calcium/sodium antiporter [Bacteroidales bacterium]NLV38863.1 calcium/sodium antiporter [Bacteroidales bacterium]HNZ80846.1 calcium/sodium antiporter [Bacteroidales bacterium]